MKDKAKSGIKAGAAFLGGHLICCSPLIFPALFGVAVSGALMGVACLLTVAGLYGGSYFLHRKNIKTAKDNTCKQHAACRQTKYLKSKPFKSASLMAGGLFLGVAFNQLGTHDHDHVQYDHHHASLVTNMPVLKTL